MPRNLSVSDLPESVDIIAARLIHAIRRAKFHLLAIACAISQMANLVELTVLKGAPAIVSARADR
jgi:hypothetical protein